MSAQPLGVGYRVQGECILRRAWDPEEVRAGTRCHHQMRPGQGPPVGQHQAAFGQVGSRDIRRHDGHRRVVLEDRPMRPGDIFSGQLRAGHLVQQWLELVIVVAVHQRHVHTLITQFVSAGDTSQTTAQDQHTVGHRHSFPNSTFRCRQRLGDGLQRLLSASGAASPACIGCWPK